MAFAINRDDNYDAMDEQKDDEGLEERPEDDELETREILFSKIRHGHRDWVSNYIKSQSTGLKKKPWARDDKGNTMLHVAVQNNHKKIASLLLKAGVNVNSVNKKGMTALDYAEMYNFHPLAEFLMLNDGVNGR